MELVRNIRRYYTRKMRKTNKGISIILYMLLGSFDVPEIRLVPHVTSDIKIIYDNFQSEQTKSKDIAAILGYKHATASRFYLRLKAMTAYGLLEGRNNYRVSELGRSIAYPEGNAHQEELRTKAVLSISLWYELYKKHKKLPPKENFWIQLKNITGMEPKKAQGIQSTVLKWYLEDIAYVQDDSTLVKEDSDQSSETIKSSTNDNDSRLRIDMETISFDKYEVTLPKGDLSKEWEKLKKYMDIKLEDYEYKEPITKNESLIDSQIIADGVEESIEE